MEAWVYAYHHHMKTGDWRQPLSSVISEISHHTNIYRVCLWCDGKTKEIVPTSLLHLWWRLVSPTYFTEGSNDRLPRIPQTNGTWNTALKGIVVSFQSSLNYRDSAEPRITSSHWRTQCILGSWEALDMTNLIFAFLHQGTLAKYLHSLVPLSKDQC